jgi:hypothetical protein
LKGAAMCEFCKAKAKAASRGREIFLSRKILVTKSLRPRIKQLAPKRKLWGFTVVQWGGI